MLNESQTDEFSGCRWLDDDEAVRLQAVHELGKEGNTSQRILVEIALGDTDNDVRCAAISYLNDLPAIKQLMQQQEDIFDAATLQYHKLLSGSIASELSDSLCERLIQELDARALKQVALLAKSKSAATLAISLISDNQELADICLFGASVFARKSAAGKIGDFELINELLEKLAGKDKSVRKVLSDRIAELDSKSASSPQSKQHDAESDAVTAEVKSADGTDLAKSDAIASAAATETAEPIIPASPGANISEEENQQASAREALDPIFQPYLELLESLVEPLNDEIIARLQEARGKLEAETAAMNPDSLPAALQELLNNYSAIMDAVANTDDAAEQIAGFETELRRLNPKHTSRINKLSNDLRQLAHIINWPKAFAANAPYLHLKGLLSQVSELITKNQHYQQQLFESSQTLVAAVKKALDDGQATEAIEAWEKIQVQISHLSGKLNKSLRKQISEHHLKIKELKDWKNYAATEKKKELIRQMQHLAEAKMHPADKARQINAMHLEWKTLGRSSQNEKLWREFKNFSDQAYEPCKEHFNLQKQLMQNNFQQRIEICTQLEMFLAALDRKSINVSGLNQLESKAKEDWKRFAPVEQNKIKKLQKRFYGIMGELRDLRNAELKSNAELKQNLVLKAQQLAALEDNAQAMHEARSLQSQWKTLGPTSFKDDRKYWEAFRAACDLVFRKRDEQKKASLNVIEKSLNETRDLLKAMDDLFARDDDTFRESRNTFSSMQRQFRETLDPKVKKERKALLDQFNDSVRKIEARFKRLPDKKMLLVKNALAQQDKFCRELEVSLTEYNDDQSITNLLQGMDSSAWDALGGSNNAAFDKAMSERFAALRRVNSMAAWEKLLRNGEEKARTLCIELEIRAGVESPAVDQQLRMKIQIDQLQNSFSKRIPVISDNTRFAQEMELQYLCTGPMSNAVRNELDRRVKYSVGKLSGN